VEPEVAVRDLHPGYLSTRVAEELGLKRTIAVQHHHAHIAACCRALARPTRDRHRVRRYRLRR
jgi:hydrogenase maturation factor HypF (carbamoyltransferase family)